MWKRLYSSIPPSRAASRALQSTSTSASSSTAPAPAAVDKQRGRTKPRARKALRRRLSYSATAVKDAETDVSTHALDAAVGAGAGAEAAFEPVRTYPVPLALHLAFSPAHLPLPLSLGTRPYTGPFDHAQLPPLFQRAAAPAPEFAAAGASVAAEHSAVLSALSHPALTHHLGAPSPFAAPAALDALAEAETFDPSARLTRLLADAQAKWSVGPSAADAAPTPAAPATAAETQAELDAAVGALEAVMARLGDAHIEMDSVKRKRKKKINKHKYKKRRKATRAERKRLGK
ncbi:hypothetical protein Q5752_002754 [Cryptotrichosporon argae]